MLFELQLNPDDPEYELHSHIQSIMDTTVVSMADKIRLELANRLQQVQYRVHKALENVAMDYDIDVSG